MPLILSSWGFNNSGQLVSVKTSDSMTGGSYGTAPFLILGIVLLVVWFLLTAMFAYYMIQFKKAQTDNKIYGKTMLFVNLGLSIVTMIFAVLLLAFWGSGASIFGGEHGVNDGIVDATSQAQNDYNACTAFSVIGFIALGATIVIMWFLLPYYGIAFDDKRILFMGEDITYKSISKIIVDKKTRATYVNYTVGKRSHKKLKFGASSAFGLFVQKNAALTGHPVEEADEKEYFQSLITTDRTAEKQFDKQVQEKIRNKDARTTSSPAKKSTKTTKSGTSKSKSKTK